MRFVNTTANYNLSIACKLASELIEDRNSKLHQSVGARERFLWSQENIEKIWCDGFDASARLRNGPIDVKVYTYRPMNPFTKAIAMTNADGAVHFNIYKINKLNVPDMVCTLTHEYSHRCGFGHGNNFKTKYKCEWSLPYHLSENASKWL